MTLRSQVQAFHAAIGQTDPTTPQVPSDERVRLRARLITEEYFETMRALFGDNASLRIAEACVLNAFDPDCGCEPRVDLVEFADGCADLAYVVEGSMLEFGINSEPIAAEVHRTNMAKVGGGKRADGKVVKPDGWQPPDIEGELRRQGWEP
jgi:predicted HAD superfamily Cof-like phosphohydrolase